MPRVPSSFYKFQSLVMESATISEVGEQPASAPAGEQVTKEKSLSFVCDGILSSLHAEEAFRDAVVDSRANVSDHSILLLLNGEFKQVKELLKFISGLQHVKGVGVGQRKEPQTQELRTVVKISGDRKDCNPTDDNRQGKDQSNASGTPTPSFQSANQPNAGGPG